MSSTVQTRIYLQDAVAQLRELNANHELLGYLSHPLELEETYDENELVVRLEPFRKDGTTADDVLVNYLHAVEDARIEIVEEREESAASDKVPEEPKVSPVEA